MPDRVLERDSFYMFPKVQILSPLFGWGENKAEEKGFQSTFY